MDYKKKYEDALKRAKIVNSGTADYNIVTQIFPELKESEDDMIRNFISHELACLRATDEKGSDRYEELTNAIAWLKEQGEKTDYNPYKLTIESIVAMVEKYATYVDLKDFYDNVAVKCHDAIEYEKNMEKLGEQKPANKVEPKFKAGDWIVNSEGKLRHIVNVDNTGYQTDKGWLSHELYETRYHRWTIQDVKDGDVLAVEPIYGYTSPFIAICKECKLTLFTSYCFIDFEGKFNKGTIGHSTNCVHPATKEQYDLLFQKMKEAGYEWDVEKKELKKIEQKSNWSEDDNNAVEVIMNIIKKSEIIDSIIYTKPLKKELFNWLKSIKERLKGE